MTTPRDSRLRVDAELDDLDRILAITNTDADEVAHATPNPSDTVFTWDYSRSRDALARLYEKAKGSQWNANTDLDWSIDVDEEKVALEMVAGDPNIEFLRSLPKGADNPMSSWGDAQWTELTNEFTRWRLSQFLHGEQGALVCTAKIVESVPWIDAKYYAATQVMDEARHVEVFGRYLTEKLSGEYPINAHLRALLDDIIADSRWDMTYLGMQIMVEGLALAAFGFMNIITTEPLLKRLLRYVMSDEARHVAFGVLSLQEVYSQLTAAELRERQEFAYEAAVPMRDRFQAQEVWQRVGVAVRRVIQLVLENPRPEADLFRQLLFSKIVPNCKKLGLLDAADGWLRERFVDMKVIQFEDAVDTGAEYEALDEVAKDREAAAV
jgi:hypothetical protein